MTEGETRTPPANGFGARLMQPLSCLRTEADYEAALAEIESFFENEPKPHTAEAARFDLLATLIEDYECRHWPIEHAT